jgi:plastocyanin
MEERKTRGLLFALASVVVLAVAPTACPASSGVAARVKHGADVTVQVRDYSFTESRVEISQGETVAWTNVGGDAHNVVFDPPIDFEQPSMPAGPGAAWPVMRRFDTPGTFTYYCRPHRANGMTGTVTVSAATPPPGGGAPPPGGTPPPGGGGGGGGGARGGGGGEPSPGTPPGGKLSTKITLQVSDPTPASGDRIRFFGSVQPEQDGRLLQLQRRGRGGSYRTVKKLKLRDAGASRSRFSGTLRVLGDAVFRARLPADSDHQTGTSRTRRLNVP